MLSRVHCLLSHTYCMLSHVHCLLSHTYCMLSHVHCLLSHTYCMLSHEHCSQSHTYSLRISSADINQELSPCKRMHNNICIGPRRPQSDPVVYKRILSSTYSAYITRSIGLRGDDYTGTSAHRPPYTQHKVHNLITFTPLLHKEQTPYHTLLTSSFINVMTYTYTNAGLLYIRTHGETPLDGAHG